MGHKGRAGSRGGITGTLGRILPHDGGPGLGRQTGLFKVDRFGNVVKVSMKKRKKGFRMPRLMAEMIRSNIEMNKAIQFKIIAESGHPVVVSRGA